MGQRSIELLNTLGFSQNYQEVQWYEYPVMADQSHQHTLSGFLQYFSDDADFDFIINTTLASSTDSVGAVKCVPTLTESSVLCSHAAVSNP